MLLGSGMIQMTGETLSPREVHDMCMSIEQHGIRFLSLRDCNLGDRELKRLLKAVGLCKSILQLNLSLGLVCDRFRVELVSQALVRNRSLRVLSLHGNKLGDEGVGIICQALSQHPHITSVDFGDCAIGDAGLDIISDLLQPHGARPGLQDLTLSANPDITARGWAKLAMAVGGSTSLRALYLDYNHLGDYGAGCLAVSLSNNRKTEILDLEGTGLTEHSAKLFLHLVKTYPVRLKQLVLRENRVHRSTVEAIKTCLKDYGSMDSETPSEAGDGPTNQSGEITEVKLQTVERAYSHDMDRSQVLDKLGEMMNTPERKEDRHVKGVKTVVEHSAPKVKTSKQLPQNSKSRQERPQHHHLTETEEWGEELKEVPF